MDFGQPNVEIGQKMANGRLLFLALFMHDHVHNQEYWQKNFGKLSSICQFANVFYRQSFLRVQS